MNVSPSWKAPPAQLQLTAKDVHIWRAGIDLPAERIQELEKKLSPDEMLRAEHFRFETDRSRFIVARGILRLILAGYLNIEPGLISFSYAENGKPRLQNIFSKKGIQFNLSHSEGLALYVFSRWHEVGVDIEFIREISEMEQIVEQFFSIRERTLYDRLPGREKHVMFYSWWTRKEALTKAVGEGLSYPLDSIDALSDEEKSVESPEFSGKANEEPRWSVWDLEPAEECVGAAVAAGTEWNVRCWQWPG
jgi:4'-phosphopantetheinyl transferase